MKNYVLGLSHDIGTIKIKVSASSLEQAIQSVMKSENAPRCAIVKHYADKVEEPQLFSFLTLPPIGGRMRIGMVAFNKKHADERMKNEYGAHKIKDSEGKQ